MALPALVQAKSGSTLGTPLATLTITLDTPTVTGNALLVVYSCFYPSEPYTAIADNASPASAFTAPPGDVSQVYQGTVCIASALSITGRAGHAVTVTKVPGNYYIVTVLEVSGLAASAALDRTQGHSEPVAGVTAYTSGVTAALTAAAEAFLLGAHATDSLTAGAVPASGWTLQGQHTDGAFHQHLIQYQAVAAALGQTYQSSGTGVHFDQSAIATYKGAVATGNTLIALGGSYAQTGTAATLRQTRRLSALGGTYTSTGAAAALRPSLRALPAASGIYTWMATAATLQPTIRALAVPSGSYTWTGAAATLRQTRALLVASASYTATGTVTLRQDHILLSAGSAAYALTGSGATLRWSAEGRATHTLLPLSGSFGWTGVPATLRHVLAEVLVAGSGLYTQVGTAATLRAWSGVTVPADIVQAALQIRTTQTAGLTIARAITTPVER